MASTILKELEEEIFFQNILKSRKQTGESVQNFKFKKDRCRLLSEYEELRVESNGVIYWMCRESRVHDNWALLYAQKLAFKFKVPLHVCFFLDDFEELYPTTRQLDFLLEGLKHVEENLEALNISFNLLKCSPLELANIVTTNDIGCVVCDFFPLRIVTNWQNKLKETLPNNVALVQVDAHNIVPCWIASDKLEKTNMSIRPKILNQLPKYLTEFPDVCKQNDMINLKINSDLIWNKNEKLNIKFVEKITWAEAGEKNGLEMLRSFLLERLKYYGISSYDPSKEHQSNLSPWIHFGQISTQRIALEVVKLKGIWREQCERFLAEAIIRKEISDNFCLYNSNYDNFNGADKWAQDSLNLHRKDQRNFIYTPEQFEEGLTHDPLWNSAQIQLLTEGKMQVYMRMYWCKKILEWTESPEEAIKIGLWLNNTYSIDGCDPNSFVGVMWSVCGSHDQGFKERAIFGKVRYMADYCLSKKYNMEAYCKRYPSKTVSVVTEKTNQNEDEVNLTQKRTKKEQVPQSRKKKKRI